MNYLEITLAFHYLTPINYTVIENIKNIKIMDIKRCILNLAINLFKKS